MGAAEIRYLWVIWRQNATADVPILLYKMIKVQDIIMILGYYTAMGKLVTSLNKIRIELK